MQGDGQDRGQAPELSSASSRLAAHIKRLLRFTGLSRSEDKTAVMQGLSFKLLALTIVFVMIGEILIFVPSVANFRIQWLAERFAYAHLAVLTLEEPAKSPNHRDISLRILRNTGVLAIVLRKESGDTQVIQLSETPAVATAHYNLGNSYVVNVLWDTWATLASGGNRVSSIGGYPIASGLVLPDGREDVTHHIDVILSEALLYEDMSEYAKNILYLSLILSCFTAGLVYVALRGLFVKPMKDLTQSVVNFSKDPENIRHIIRPSGRSDEIGLAEEKLANMQEQLAETLKERKRLASLGLAVSKINHDLRNMLASAHLISDRLSSVSDPTVQRFVPKLINTLDRASAFCETTLAYGRAQERPPERRLLRLHDLCKDVAQDAGIFESTTIDFINEIPHDLEIDADPGQLHRVLLNLCRNAAQALESMMEPHTIRRLTLQAKREGAVVTIIVRDTGPGLPERAKEYLFQPFHGSVRPGGIGLGLSIAAELVQAHAGTLTLKDVGAGTAFEITIPDQPIEMARERAVRNTLEQSA